MSIAVALPMDPLRLLLYSLVGKRHVKIIQFSYLSLALLHVGAALIIKSKDSTKERRTDRCMNPCQPPWPCEIA